MHPTTRQAAEKTARLANAIALALSLLVSATLVSSLFYNQQSSFYLGLSGLTLAMGLLVTLLFSCHEPVRRWSPILLLTVAFWLWFLIRSQWSEVRYASDAAVWTLFALPACALLSFWLSQRTLFWRYCQIMLVVITTCLTLYALYQYFALHERPRGTFINRNNFAAMLSIMVVLAMGWLIQDRKEKATLVLTLSFILLLTFVIGLIGSRGVFLALAAAFGILLLGCFKTHVSKRPWCYGLGATISGLVAANLLDQGAVGARINTLAAPFEAGSDRFIIWTSSLDMAAEVPWYGIGPGLYWLFWPQYRNPMDSSAGFYVHNDYLQFFIESGWPALVLLVALFAAVLIQTVRFCMSTHTPTRKVLEATALFAALFMVTAHSLLTFNLYLMPLLIVTGLVLGRLCWLTSDTYPHKESEVQPPSLSRFTPIVLAIALLAPAHFYLKAIGGGLHIERALTAIEQNELAVASSALVSAQRRWPEVDFYYYVHAWVLGQQHEAEQGENAIALHEHALSQLDKAETLNPFRPQTHYIRGRLLQDRVSGVSQQLIYDSYKKALSLDPRYLDARFFLARIKLANNEIEAGVGLLEEGIDWHYPITELTLNYYRLTAELRRILGDQDGYQDLMHRIEDLRPRLTAAQPLAPR